MLKLLCVNDRKPFETFSLHDRAGVSPQQRTIDRRRGPAQCKQIHKRIRRTVKEVKARDKSPKSV